MSGSQGYKGTGSKTERGRSKHAGKAPKRGAGNNKRERGVEKDGTKTIKAKKSRQCEVTRVVVRGI